MDTVLGTYFVIGMCLVGMIMQNEDKIGTLLGGRDAEIFEKYRDWIYLAYLLFWFPIVLVGLVKNK